MSLGYIGDKFPYQDRQIALGRFMSALMIGQIAGSTLGGLFGQYIGWRYIFIVFGIVALAVSVMLAREGRKYPETTAAARPLGRAILTVPLGGSLVFVGLLGVVPGVGSAVFEGAGAILLAYALATQYGSLMKRPTAPQVLGVTSFLTETL